MDEQLNTVPMIAANLNYPPCRAMQLDVQQMHARTPAHSRLHGRWLMHQSKPAEHTPNLSWPRAEARPGAINTALAQLGDTDTPPLNSLVGQLSIQAFTAAWVQPL